LITCYYGKLLNNFEKSKEQCKAAVDKMLLDMGFQIYLKMGRDE